MIRLALSIASGLAHLHMEIVGTQGMYFLIFFLLEYEDRSTKLYFSVQLGFSLLQKVFKCKETLKVLYKAEGFGMI